MEIDLSEQRLYAHEGQATVLNARVSTGTWQYPTVTGRFTIYAKYRATRMTGPGYDLPNVPWTMFFYGGYAIHGTYWHNNFGTPMSHGCVNMKTLEAKWLYNWAPKGTLVVVHQ
ncbi:MAG: L,D-transpeptidase [Anaerolineae bacterium]|nr:L,D-transpeptidase [Anaerolineae bacterium]